MLHSDLGLARNSLENEALVVASANPYANHLFTFLSTHRLPVQPSVFFIVYPSDTAPHNKVLYSAFEAVIGLGLPAPGHVDRIESPCHLAPLSPRPLPCRLDLAPPSMSRALVMAPVLVTLPTSLSTMADWSDVTFLLHGPHLADCK